MRKPQSQKVSQSWIKITWFSAKFEFGFESFKSKFTLILSVSKLMIGCSKNNNIGCSKNAFEQKKKKPRLNLTLGQALISLRTTGPWSISLSSQSCLSLLTHQILCNNIGRTRKQQSVPNL